MPALTVSVSNAVDVVVSAVSTCSQNDRVSREHPTGTVTCCERVSVWALPYPSSQASHEPECGGSLVESLTTPDDAVHGAAVPVSNPGLPNSCPPGQPPVVGDGDPPPPAPASHAVALSASAASVPAGSSQPSKRVLPDWPVPSSTVELSPQTATLPTPKVLVVKKAPVVPDWLADGRHTRPLTLALSAGCRVWVLPLRMILPVTVPNGPCSTGLALSPAATGFSLAMFTASTLNPNGSVSSTPLFVNRSFAIRTESQPSLSRSLPVWSTTRKKPPPFWTKCMMAA